MQYNWGAGAGRKMTGVQQNLNLLSINLLIDGSKWVSRVKGADRGGLPIHDRDRVAGLGGGRDGQES